MSEIHPTIQVLASSTYILINGITKIRFFYSKILQLNFSPSQYFLVLLVRDSKSNTHEQITLVHMHISVHEVENGEPEGHEGGQGQKWSEVVEEHFWQHSSCPHARFLHASWVLWAEWLQQLGQQRKEDLVEARLPLGRCQCLQVMNQQCPLEICDGTHAHLHMQIKSMTRGSTHSKSKLNTVTSSTENIQNTGFELLL